MTQPTAPSVSPTSTRALLSSQSHHFDIGNVLDSDKEGGSHWRRRFVPFHAADVKNLKALDLSKETEYTADFLHPDAGKCAMRPVFSTVEQPNIETQRFASPKRRSLKSTENRSGNIREAECQTLRNLGMETALADKRMCPAVKHRNDYRKEFSLDNSGVAIGAPMSEISKSEAMCTENNEEDSDNPLQNGTRSEPEAKHSDASEEIGNKHTQKAMQKQAAYTAKHIDPKAYSQDCENSAILAEPPEAAVLKNKLYEAEKEVKILQHRCEEQKRDYEKLHRENSELKIKLQRNEDTIITLNGTIQALKAAMSKAEHEICVKQTEKEALSSNLENLEKQLYGCRNDAKSIKEFANREKESILREYECLNQHLSEELARMRQEKDKLARIAKEATERLGKYINDRLSAEDTTIPEGETYETTEIASESDGKHHGRDSLKQLEDKRKIIDGREPRLRKEQSHEIYATQLKQEEEIESLRQKLAEKSSLNEELLREREESIKYMQKNVDRKVMERLDKFRQNYASKLSLLLQRHASFEQ